MKSFSEYDREIFVFMLYRSTWCGTWGIWMFWLCTGKLNFIWLIWLVDKWVGLFADNNDGCITGTIWFFEKYGDEVYLFFNGIYNDSILFAGVYLEIIEAFMLKKGWLFTLDDVLEWVREFLSFEYLFWLY